LKWDAVHETGENSIVAAKKVAAEKQKRAFGIGVAVAAAAFVCFAWLADEVERGRTALVDSKVRDAIHAHASPRLTLAMRGITELGEPWFLVTLGVVAAGYLAYRGRKLAAWLLVAASVGGAAFDTVLKVAFHRTRPEAFFGFISPGTYSFPSGHALTSSCFYGVLAAILGSELAGWRRTAIWIVAGTLVLLIGLSRVYLGVHYPTDIIGGCLGAGVWVALVRGGYWLWKRRAARILAAAREGG
jgi:membrane-associated phospholipid phosphatase